MNMTSKKAIEAVHDAVHQRLAVEVVLLACPFCGGEPKMNASMGEWWATCTCNSAGPLGNSADEAAAGWNRRVEVAGRTGPQIAQMLADEAAVLNLRADGAEIAEGDLVLAIRAEVLRHGTDAAARTRETESYQWPDEATRDRERDIAICRDVMREMVWSDALGVVDAAISARTAIADAFRGLPAPLVSTIHWTRTATDGLPAFGRTVAIWIPSLGVTVRAYRDGTATDGDDFRVSGVDGPRIAKELVAAWAEIPNGPLPPPDGGAA